MMRSHQWLVVASLLLLAAGLLSVACGGAGDERGPPDLSRIATATLPNPLPEPLIVGEVSAVPQGATYIVRPGDSPASIAERFGIAVETIMEANGITDPTRLEVGQVLTIPGATPGVEEVMAATAEPSSTPEPEEPTIYIVEPGDIPETIAEQFGITADALMEANGITDPTSLDIGQELVIPSPAPTATPEP